ncbi:cytosolic Fe-S cluster assembly factor cfd1, partial [Coelomomyces lativittatus]
MNADPSLPPPPLTPSTSMAYKGVVSSSLSQVKNILLVLSGKGGVGKSTVTTQLALSLFHHVSEPHIGVLDIDLCGPSLPKMFGVHASKVYQSNAGKWVPVIVPGSQNRLKIMSMGVLLPHPDDAVVWRGPKKNAMIRQFLEEVHWGTCEYLIIDTPPGTSDEHIALIETLKEVTRKAAILVTTPQ